MSEQSPEELAPADKQSLGIGKGTPGPGRPKGSLNRTTALLKDAILLAAQRAGGDDEDGIVNYLQEQAKENPGPFLALLGKVLPMTIAGDPDNPLKTIAKVEIEVIG